MNDYFFIQSGREFCRVVCGLQLAADCLHKFLCSCNGVRWIDCNKPLVKGEINRLFYLENWILDDAHQPFRFDSEFGHTFSRIIKLRPPDQPRLHCLHFIVPLLPPSVNHYKKPNKQGGWRTTPETKAFMEAVGIFAHTATPDNWPQDINLKLAGIRPFYEVDLIFYIHQPSFLKCDSDNLEKVAFDALTRCGVISDDRYIKFHTNRTFPIPQKVDERTEYKVRITPEP